MATNDIETVLNLEELRARCLVHTRKAYQLLPSLSRPRILDIGCGQGQQTLELTRLGDGDIVAIDTNKVSLAHLQASVKQGNLTHRIEVVCASLYQNGFLDGSFDLLWEEGVFHLLESTKSIPECKRLLKPGGFLVMHEDVTWFESARETLQFQGFHLVDEHPLPRHFWWTDYYAPLEKAIQRYQKICNDEGDSAKIAQYQREISMVKADPDRFDCAFFVVQKRRENHE